MRHRNRLVGFTYDEAAGVAHFSMYVPGTAGRDRKRATVSAATYDDAVRLWSDFRSRASDHRTKRRPSVSSSPTTSPRSPPDGIRRLGCAAVIKDRSSSAGPAEFVLHPGLPAHPNHDLAGRQMKRFGAMISFEIHGSVADGIRVVSGRRVWTLGESLCGVESLLEHPQA